MDDKLPLNTKYIFCFDITQPVMTSQTNYIKRTIVVQFAIGLLLLFFPINYNVFAQTRELSEEEQPEDITDFADLTTAAGSAQINGSPSDSASSNGTDEDEADLTTAEFSPIRESAATAREAIQDNDSIAAYDALNLADNFLFGVINKIAPEGGESSPTGMTEQLNLLQTHLDAARDALASRDNIKSMEEINSIDTILFNVARSLEDEN
jgi:hypothetical protein